MTFKQKGRVPPSRPLCTLIGIDSILSVIIVIKAVESKDKSKRNRSNMGSDSVLSHYNFICTLVIMATSRLFRTKLTNPRHLVQSTAQ